LKILIVNPIIYFVFLQKSTLCITKVKKQPVNNRTGHTESMNPDIYNTLRNRIIHLEYDPGQILKEQILAAEFGVSRTPLRTVLLHLEWEHLVKILPRTGIQVMELELNTITHVFQARLELESVIGTLAAQQFSPDHFARITRLSLGWEELMEKKDPYALGRRDQEIKQLFHDAAGNPFLVEMSDRLYALTFRLWFFNLVKMDRSAWHQEVTTLRDEITDLTGLVKTGSPRQVGCARRDYLLKHLKRIRSKFLGLSSP
jgi:DNA-binding GntR family transcriptional regulator